MGNHVLLAVARALSQFPDTRSQTLEEYGFIFHPQFVSDCGL